MRTLERRRPAEVELELRCDEELERRSSFALSMAATWMECGAWWAGVVGLGDWWEDMVLLELEMEGEREGGRELRSGGILREVVDGLTVM